MAIRMETDRAFAEIFGHRPDWLALVAGREFPLAASAQPKVFKPKVECDLVLEPSGVADPHVVCEFQFYHDHSIFPRTEIARLSQWRRVNPVEECRKRDYVPQRVEAFILFGDRGHLPTEADRFPQIHHAFLGERLAELEREAPDCPIIALLRPVVADSDTEVETKAPQDYHALRGHAGLEEEDRLCFSAIYVQFLMQRFRSRSPEEIRAMIGELLPVEETRAGRELIERGFERGVEQVTLALLERVCGGLDSRLRVQVEALPLAKAEELALALLDFRSVADLQAWLATHA